MTGLLVATVQLSAILLVALGLASLLRRQAASLRHVVIALGMACAAVVPLVSALLPPWVPQWSVLPADFEVNRTAVAVSAALREPPSLRGIPVMPSPAQGAARTAPSDHEASAPQEGTATIDPDSPPHARKSMLNPPAPTQIIRRAYLVGLAVAITMLVMGLLQVCWIAARARPLHHPAWQRHLAEGRRAYGLRRCVQLKLSSHPSVLATWGLVRPQVLLPAGAEHWPEDRIRAVLLHELAHVRRNDWLIQLLACALCAFHWFNPLVWIAFRRLRHESEQSCDDAVIGQDVDSVGYASQLLALARGFTRTALLPAPVPSMARRSSLQQRVIRVLDPAAVRTGAGQTRITGLAAALLIAASAVAACDGVQRRPADDAVVPTVTVASEALAQNASVVPSDPPHEAQGQDAERVEATPEPAAPIQKAAEIPKRSSPQQVVADILELVRAALADESTSVLDEITYPITGLNRIQRYALAVVGDDGRQPALLAANCVEIINALVNTGHLAANVTRRPGRTELPPGTFDELSRNLLAKAAELSAALMPASTATSPVASTPERRAAAIVLDLVQATQRDVSFVGPRQGSWLVTELDTLERAASSVAHDGAIGGAATLKLQVLQSAIQSTARQASQIASRPNAPAANRSKAAALMASLQDVAARLDAAMTRSQPDVSSVDPMALLLAGVAEEVQGLRLASLLHLDDMFVATLGRGDMEALNVLIEEARTEGEAAQKEQRSVFSTPATGFVQERNGMRLHTWGAQEDASGYRVLTRIGTRVVNVSAPPELGRFVLPVLDGIAARLR